MFVKFNKQWIGSKGHGAILRGVTPVNNENGVIVTRTATEAYKEVDGMPQHKKFRFLTEIRAFSDGNEMTLTTEKLGGGKIAYGRVDKVLVDSEGYAVNGENGKPLYEQIPFILLENPSNATQEVADWVDEQIKEVYQKMQEEIASVDQFCGLAEDPTDGVEEPVEHIF